MKTLRRENTRLRKEVRPSARGEGSVKKGGNPVTSAHCTAMSREVSLRAKADEIFFHRHLKAKMTSRVSSAKLCRSHRVGSAAWRVRPMSQRQRDDMVILAHIREQRRLSLQSYGRPRMAEERCKTSLVKVGHQRVGRLMAPRMAPRSSEPRNTSRRRTAITGSTLRQTYWRRTSQQILRSGPWIWRSPCDNRRKTAVIIRIVGRNIVQTSAKSA